MVVIKESWYTYELKYRNEVNKKLRKHTESRLIIVVALVRGEVT